MPRHSRVDEVGDRALRELECGATVAAAAHAAGIPEPTLATWVRRGRLDPEGRFGRFGAAVPRRAVAFEDWMSAVDQLRRLDLEWSMDSLACGEWEQ